MRARKTLSAAIYATTPTMIELGCNWAFYSLWFAKEIKDPTNYLIEPGRNHLELGMKNFQLNNLKGIFAQAFIGHPVNNDDCTHAQRIGIDQFLENNQIEHVNILHSDIQGFEYEMLRSSEQSIHAKKIDYFLISTHGDEVHQSCLDYLLAHDYQIIAEHSMAEGYMPDGFIGAKRKDVIGPEHVPISKLAKNCRIW